MYTDFEQRTETNDVGTSKLVLFWRIKYGSCARPLIYIHTLNHTLYPHNHFIPIARYDEYNVTIVKRICSDEDHMTEVNVTLSLVLNDNVRQHVPYVVCIVRRRSGGYSDIRSNEVHLPEPATEQERPTTLPLEILTTSTIRQNVLNATQHVNNTPQGIDLGTFIGDCVPCSAVRHLQALYVCTILFLVTNLLYRVLG